MKKYLLIFLLILFNISLAQDINPFSAPNGDAKYDVNLIKNNSEEKFKQQNEKKQNVVTKLFNKEKNNKKKKNKKDVETKGYYGTLPDIESEFQYKKQITKPSVQDGIKVVDSDDFDEENLKPAPNDTLFLDNVIKKDTTSYYLNDLKRVKMALTNLKKCLEENADIQRFNACVNMVDLYTKNLQNKYSNQSESLKESYIDILSTNYYAKVLGNLKYDSNYYSKYIPTQQGKYSRENIQIEEEKLLVKVNKTLFLINQEE